jgi:hypothetical protein
MTRRAKNRPSRQSCGKRRYRSAEEAIAAKHTIENAHKDGRAFAAWKPTSHYECPRCKGWHLTKQTSGEPTEGAA